MTLISVDEPLSSKVRNEINANQICEIYISYSKLYASLANGDTVCLKRCRNFDEARNYMIRLEKKLMESE